MPFKLQGSSTLVIKPCYDGRALPGTYNVAGDGLALLSIKDCHQNCTLTCDSGSKLPCLSCARGIKPRNSFRNLLKPDVRKVRGIENPTTESIIQLFQTHNLERCGSKTYRKKVLSKLGSFISKKSKTETQPILIQNTSWPINFCVLSSICQETEMVAPEILINKNLSKDRDFVNEITIKEEDFEASNSNILNNEVGKDAVFLTLPSFNIQENTSDDFIPVSNLLDPSNGDSFTKTPLPFNSGSPRNCLGYDVCDEASSSSQVMSSSILLESKQSHHQISIPSNLEFYKSRECNGITMGRENTLTKENQLEQKENVLFSNFISNDNGIPVTEEPPSMVVQSIFSDIFQDIEEVKDAISSYMSSFYVQEEEYNNFPAMHIASKEVASHFLEQIHGVKNNNSNNDHSTLSHGIAINVENGCLLEHTLKENVDYKIHKKPQDIHLVQDESFATPHSYCYWDENDLENDKLLQKPVDSNISENDTKASLVPLAFVEKMWEEFTTQIQTHALFLDLVDENEMKKFEPCERNFPSYGHWFNVYDPSIFEEAENIVHTIDSLFMNGCFPGDESNNAASYIPCTIVELLDDREFNYGPEERLNENGNKPNEDENILTKQENQTSHKNEVKSNENENFKSRPPVNEIIDRIKIHEIKLEPVFNQEKVTIHEIDYSREPEYEKINLNRIIHRGRVSFSSLHSDPSSPDLPAAIETVKYNKEQINEHIIPRENTSPNYSDKENSPIVFLGTNSKDQLTPDKYTEKSSSLDALDKDGPDSGLSMFERIPERNSTEHPNPAFLFSSPTVQINLTNTFINSNRK